MEPSVRLWRRNPTPNDAHEAGACPASTVAAVEPTLSHVSMVHSSNMDEFAASLEGLLASTTGTSSDHECEDDMDRIKRRKVEDPGCSTWQLDSDRSSEASVKEDTCTHPGCVKGMCVVCGRKVDYDTRGAKCNASVAFNYILEGTLLGKDEIARVRNKEWPSLLR